jgi:hypothetical protein
MPLYVVPALYLLLAKNTRSPEYMSRLIETLGGRKPAPGVTPAARETDPG